MKAIDITKHKLVPKHVLAGDKEKKDLLDKYKVDLADLPKILKTDPAIKALVAKPGDVIKIIRTSPTAGEAVSYRVVVNV
ncbi:MAG: DNA-directed RNA polymerase subunit H [Nanoarchaeota archaeon]